MKDERLIKEACEEGLVKRLLKSEVRRARLVKRNSTLRIVLQKKT